MIEVVSNRDLVQHTGVRFERGWPNMPMIPLPIVLALVPGYFLLLELKQPPPRNRFALAFLGLLMVQLSLVGLRYGYGISVLWAIFPLTASLVGPLAFLSFQNPANFKDNLPWPGILHLLPLVVAVLFIFTAPQYIDLAQGLFTLIYAMVLILRGLREQDFFSWVDFNRREYIRRALWCVVTLALISSATDFAIVVDVWRSQGANISTIVGWTAIFLSLFFITFIVTQKYLLAAPSNAPGKDSRPVNDAEEIELLERLDTLVESTQIHLDPGLNLNRIARKLGVPARQVSTAINRQREISVSQFVNNLRIDEVCRLLRDPELSITQAMFQSGFVTKSNFNREFSRRMGKSPSVWRKSSCPGEA